MTGREESPRTDPADDGGSGAPAEDASALAVHPKRWRALLFAHTATALGDCRSCTGVRWPCGPRRLAEEAERRHAAARATKDAAGPAGAAEDADG